MLMVKGMVMRHNSTRVEVSVRHLRGRRGMAHRGMRPRDGRVKTQAEGAIWQSTGQRAKVAVKITTAALKGS